MDKQSLRADMRLLNRSLAPDERAAASARIFAAVERTAQFAAAQTVALYCSMQDEPATEEILRRWSRTCRVVVPRVEGDIMRFFDYHPARLCRGSFGIAEPSADAVPCDPVEIDLVIVPGVAFTASGARLGRGKGYYDKYLSQPDVRAARVGVCFAHQLLDSLPSEPHDVCMDSVCAG